MMAGGKIGIPHNIRQFLPDTGGGQDSINRKKQRLGINDDELDEMDMADAHSDLDNQDILQRNR